MDKLYALCTSTTGQSFTHEFKDGVHAMRFTDSAGVITQESGTNVETVAAQLFAKVDPVAAAIKRKAQALEAYAQKNNLEIVFTVTEKRCMECHPPRYASDAQLTVGEKTFVNHFSHWNEEKMKGALMVEAHDVLVK